MSTTCRFVMMEALYNETIHCVGVIAHVALIRALLFIGNQSWFIEEDLLILVYFLSA